MNRKATILIIFLMFVVFIAGAITSNYTTYSGRAIKIMDGKWIDLNGQGIGSSTGVGYAENITCISNCTNFNNSALGLNVTLPLDASNSSQIINLNNTVNPYTVSAKNVTGTIAETQFPPFYNASQVQNVKAYGAKGDNITDDTAAINAAISNTTNGTVYLPSGIYNVTTIQLTEKSARIKLLLNPDTKIRCQITGDCIKFVGLIGNNNHIGFSGIEGGIITVGAPASNLHTNMSIINFTYCDKCYVRNVQIEGGGNLGAIYLYQAWGGDVLGNVFINNYRTISINNDTNAIRIFNNEIYSSNASGIWSSGINNDNIQIYNNYIEGLSAVPAVKILPSNDKSWTISNNYFNQNTGGDIITESETTLITGNTFNSHSGGESAIMLNVTRNFVVANQFIAINPGYAIDGNGTDNFIAMNSFKPGVPVSQVTNLNTTVGSGNEFYGNVPLAQDTPGSYAGGTIPANQSISISIIVNGAELGDFCIASASVDLTSEIVSCQVSSANTVKAQIYNTLNTPATIPALTIRVRVEKSGK